MTRRRRAGRDNPAPRACPATSLTPCARLEQLEPRLRRFEAPDNEPKSLITFTVDEAPWTTPTLAPSRCRRANVSVDSRRATS